jgi:superfamily II DNA or RNA helicase
VSTLVLSPGQVVRNRARLWRIDAQLGTELLATSIDGGETEQHRFYLPFEKVEPGHLELPDPERVGHPAAQDLLLRSFRLNMLHGTAPLLSLQRSGVVPNNYQLVPVVMALDMARVRLLLADDVGLGKTIEAGLILTELMARQRAAKILIVCPATLREQWQEALDTFFHIRPRIISSRHLREMERQLPAGANPWEFHRQLIVSVDYAKGVGVRHQILEQSWDLVIWDEAHQAAKPHRTTDEAVDMERWELAQALSSRTTHLLLLTATPHNGYTDSYASLLSLLDVGAVVGPPHAPQIDRAIARRHVCQRRRRDVETWFRDASGGQSPFPRRDQDEVVVNPTSQEEGAIEAIRAYGTLVLESATGTRRQSVAHWTVMHLHKRALSSPAALRESLKNRRQAIEERLRRATEGESEDTVSNEVARATALDNDPGERFTEEEAGRRVERATYGTPAALRREKEVVEAALLSAEAVTPTRDSKLQMFLQNTLRERLAAHPRVLVFTKYTDTLRYLESQIGKSPRYAEVKVVTLDGSLSEAQRKERFREFEQAPKAILLATDCISEGVNLQRACCQIIHWELPWNPNRLEQRNGRVDRYGQPEPTVTIRTMVMNDTLDAFILKVLVQKARAIREEYGFSPPYFGDDINVLDLIQERGLTLSSGKAGQLTLDMGESAGKERNVDSPFADAVLDRIRDESFYGQTDLALPDVESRLRETARTVGSTENVRQFVLSALNRFHCPVEANKDGTFRIRLSNPAVRTTALGEEIARATFDAREAVDDPDLQVLDVGHPLVRRLIEVLKHATFLSGEHYGRTAAMTTSAASEVTAVLHILVRYLVRTEPIGIVEELVPVAYPVYGGVPLSAEAVNHLLAAVTLPEQRREDEMRETLRDALQETDVTALIRDAAEACRRELVAERRAMREKLAANGAAEAAWLHGIDDLSVASTDLLTVCIYYPG